MKRESFLINRIVIFHNCLSNPIIYKGIHCIVGFGRLLRLLPLTKLSKTLRLDLFSYGQDAYGIDTLNIFYQVR